MKNKEYERYTEVYDSVIKKHLETMFKKSFVKGYTITDIVRLNEDKWIIKWYRVFSEEVK